MLRVFGGAKSIPGCSARVADGDFFTFSYVFCVNTIVNTITIVLLNNAFLFIVILDGLSHLYFAKYAVFHLY